MEGFTSGLKMISSLVFISDVEIILALEHQLLKIHRSHPPRALLLGDWSSGFIQGVGVISGMVFILGVGVVSALRPSFRGSDRTRISTQKHRCKEVYCTA